MRLAHRWPLSLFYASKSGRFLLAAIIKECVLILRPKPCPVPTRLPAVLILRTNIIILNCYFISLLSCHSGQPVCVAHSRAAARTASSFLHGLQFPATPPTEGRNRSAHPGQPRVGSSRFPGPKSRDPLQV